jgi:hypothetical protein
MNFWEFVAYDQITANAFHNELKEKGFDVEEPEHATKETDGRAGMPGFADSWWGVTVYMDYEHADPSIPAALVAIAEQHGMEDWGSEPSHSFEHGERDGSISARIGV